jgi:hypothetical protein
LEQVRLDTQSFDLPVRRMIAIVPSPSAVASTILARQTTFRGVLRSATSRSSRPSGELPKHLARGFLVWKRIRAA